MGNPGATLNVERRTSDLACRSSLLEWSPVHYSLGAGAGSRFRLLLAVLLLAAPLALANLPPKKDQIPQLRPPRGEIPPDFWEQHGAGVVGGAVVLVVLAAGAVWWLLRPKPPVPVPPAVEARQALEPLRHQPEDGRLLSRVSQVLRHYVGAAFGLPPGERTTSEFCRAIAGHEQIGGELSKAAGEFLRQCDERKFAPAPPPEPLDAVAQAARLIEMAEARRAALAEAAAQAVRPPGEAGAGR